MKKHIALACVSLVIATEAAQAADANQGAYVRLDTGWSFSTNGRKDLQDGVDDSPIVGGGVGYRFNQYLRADATVGYRGGFEVDADSTAILLGTTRWQSDVTALTGMVNVYGEAGKFGLFTPYVGAGIGISRNKMDSIAISNGVTTGTIDDATVDSIAWQVSVGTGVEVAPQWTLDVGYRYVDLGEVQSGDTATLNGARVSGDPVRGHIRAHEIQAGVRYQF